VGSDSEADDRPDTRITLAEQVRGKGNRASQKSAIRLKELGPRMQLQCIKITQDFMGGFVIYNKFQSKTPEEIESLKTKRKNQAMLKQQRKAQQARNVERKQRAAAKLDGDDADDEVFGEDSKYTQAGDYSDDDASYFKQAVGQAPDKGMFEKGNKRKRKNPPSSSSTSSSSSSSKASFASTGGQGLSWDKPRSAKSEKGSGSMPKKRRINWTGDRTTANKSGQAKAKANRERDANRN
jgi:ribosome biogenesis protein SSF1/2